jgi:hypothetical protein
MLILSFTGRSLCDDLANLPITLWSPSQISHDSRAVREHTGAYPISIWSAPSVFGQLILMDPILTNLEHSSRSSSDPDITH